MTRSELPSVLLISADTIGPRMAGSGIRYFNFARLLAREQRVTLAAPNPVTIIPPPGVEIASYDGPEVDEDERGDRLARLVAGHDVVVAQQLPYYHTDPDVLASRYIVVDLYSPGILENLEYTRVDPERGEQVRKDDIAILTRLLTLGDFFICASERQRDFWLGALAARGRLEPAHVAANPDLRTLIDVVPFGLPEAPPEKTGPGPRATFGFDQSDPVLLWNGGLWNWLDPLTAIRATALLAREHPRVRLVFMGTKSPVANVADMVVVEEARGLAEELGLLDVNVFFNDWVPYDQRQNWLLESDVALTLHEPTVEARYAFRTRLLDNLWCGVPAVATAGDVLADLVDAEGIGRAVPPGDTEAVAGAVAEIIDSGDRTAIRARIADVARRYTWEQVTKPLAAYCRSPWRLGTGRGQDPVDAYIHHLERIYDETAGYARYLERVVEEKNRALSTQFRARALAADVASYLRRRLQRG